MYPIMNLYQGDEACVLFVQHTSLRIGEDKARMIYLCSESVKCLSFMSKIDQNSTVEKLEMITVQ